MDSFMTNGGTARDKRCPISVMDFICVMQKQKELYLSYKWDSVPGVQ